jgi:hypothetical protein
MKNSCADEPKHRADDTVGERDLASTRASARGVFGPEIQKLPKNRDWFFTIAPKCKKCR